MYQQVCIYWVTENEMMFNCSEGSHWLGFVCVQSVVIKMGKKTEQLSIDKKEFANWWTVLQQAYCFGESLEFDEDEELSECVSVWDISIIENVAFGQLKCFSENIVS